MKAVVQRVTSSQVTVDDKVVGKIGPGLVVLLGITHADTEKECTALSEKIVNLRIFTDDQGKMNRSVKDCMGEILIVSQFTLYGDISGGRRPSFTEAAPPEIAEPLYKVCVEKLKMLLGKEVATGIFGAKMKLMLINDGPVTLLVQIDKKL